MQGGQGPEPLAADKWDWRRPRGVFRTEPGSSTPGGTDPRNVAPCFGSPSSSSPFIITKESILRKVVGGGGGSGGEEGVFEAQEER